MNILNQIDAGEIIAILLACGGPVLGYIVSRARSDAKTAAVADEANKDIEALGHRVDRHESELAAVRLRSETELAAVRLHVAEHTVRKDELNLMESRISKRVDTLEHSIRNMIQTLIGEVAQRMRLKDGN
jgi:hypothetical protein